MRNNCSRPGTFLDSWGATGLAVGLIGWAGEVFVGTAKVEEVDMLICSREVGKCPYLPTKGTFEDKCPFPKLWDMILLSWRVFLGVLTSVTSGKPGKSSFCMVWERCRFDKMRWGDPLRCSCTYYQVNIQYTAMRPRIDISRCSRNI